MAIIIENFNTDSPKVKQKKSEVEKQEYLKFLIEKGIDFKYCKSTKSC